MATTPPPAPPKKGTEIDRIYEALKASEEVEVRRLPESVFYGNFLPFFCGEPVPEHVNMTTWIGIAGNPFRPVDIVSSDGEVVLRIPPMFEMDGIGISNREKFSLHGMLTTMEQMNTSFPARAKQYYDAHMAALDITHDPKPYISRYIEEWNKVFARYNKPLFVSVEKAKELSTQTERNRPQLNFNDDDLL